MMDDHLVPLLTSYVETFIKILDVDEDHETMNLFRGIEPDNDRIKAIEKLRPVLKDIHQAYLEEKEIVIRTIDI